MFGKHKQNLREVLKTIGKLTKIEFSKIVLSKSCASSCSYSSRERERERERARARAREREIQRGHERETERDRGSA